MSSTGKRSLVNLIIVGILILATVLITASPTSGQTVAIRPVNIAINNERSGYPSPLETDTGYSTDYNKWYLVDGVTNPAGYWEGVAFTSKESSWWKEFQHITLDFGKPKTFNQIEVWDRQGGPNLWYRGDNKKVEYWDGSKWIEIVGGNWSLQRISYYENPVIYSFSPVTATKVRFSCIPKDWIWVSEFRVLTLDTTPTTGSITVTTNLSGATFSLTGASSYSGSGTSWSSTSAPAGTYTITYGTVTGYNTPPSETKTLKAGGSITFSGTYVPIADTTEGFEDDFNSQLLDTSWQVVEKVPGIGRYSLTDNPGYLRYYLEGSQGSMGGWRNNYQTSGAWKPSLTLIRPFDGENWSLTAKVNYNLRAHIGGSSTGAQGQNFWIAFGEGTNDYLSIYRGVDWWYKSNVLTMELVSNGVSVAKFSGAPSSVGADGWVRESYWYEIIKDGGKITVRFSNDGSGYTTAFSFARGHALLTEPVTATQKAIIDMNLWNGVGSYVDWDYIHVVVLDGISIPTITPTVTPPPTCKEPTEKFETALKNFREAEDKLKVAEAKFEPQMEQFQAEKRAFEDIAESLKKEDRQVKKEELRRKGEEIERLAQEHQKIVKEFLERRIDLLVADIQLLKCDAKFAGNGEALPFDASATLDKHIMELEQIRTRVQQASKKQDMKSINQDLKDIKEKFELEKRYFNGIRVNNNMDDFFARTDDASVRMNELIKKLNEQGKDTSKLTGIASDFNNLMNQAKENHKKTLDLFREHSGFDSAGMVTDIRKAEDFIRQIREQQKDTQRLRSAIAKLREFFGETKRLIKGTQESAAPVTGGVIT